MKYYKIISLLLCGSLTVSMAGCGASDKKQSINFSSETESSKEAGGTRQTEEIELAKEEARRIAEEATKKVLEEENRKREREEKKKAEEEEEKKAEEEEKRKEEEEKKRVEEEKEKLEAKKKEEEEKARLKAEEEAKKLEEQKNSYAMMYYLAVTSENIRNAKDNRLMLDDIYSSLLNDINPGAVDETTQDHLNNLRDIIKKYRNTGTKRERLQYIYNQNKAEAMRDAIPNPLTVLLMTKPYDLNKLAMTAGYTIVDSYRNYKNASENAEKAYLTSGWELDDEELEAIYKNRERAFDYMVDMVQKNHLEGKNTLSEKDIEEFSDICCNTPNKVEEIQRLKGEEKKYKLLGNYWFELADCYFQNKQYKECLDCVDKYIDLSSDIYRKDRMLVQLLPKAIVSAQNVYKDNNHYETVVKEYGKKIIDNAEKEDDWSERYFVAQAYIELYSKTKKQGYLKDAFNIVYENVIALLGGQREINDTYKKPVKEIEIGDSKGTEKEDIKKYNKSLKTARETELVSLYEPLVLNCELLFSLADKVNLSQGEKKKIDSILKDNVFLVEPIKNAYSFNKDSEDYDIKLTKKEIIIPASLLTSKAVIEVDVTDGNGTKKIDDCKVSKVERVEETVDMFKAHISSKQWKKMAWTDNSNITIKIKYPDVYDKEISLKYSVNKTEKMFHGFKVPFSDEVVFDKE